MNLRGEFEENKLELITIQLTLKYIGMIEMLQTEYRQE